MHIAIYHVAHCADYYCYAAQYPRYTRGRPYPGEHERNLAQLNHELSHTGAEHDYSQWLIHKGGYIKSHSAITTENPTPSTSQPIHCGKLPSQEPNSAASIHDQ